jgi:predicted O-methyltransferase YrrM
MINEEDYSARGWDVLPCFTKDALLPYELIQEMEEHPEAAGKSSWGTRNLLFSLILSMRPKIVLEIGAHIGSATIIIGSALKANNFGTLFSLEPQSHYFNLLIQFIEKAEVNKFVKPLKIFSTDPSLGDFLGEKADIIFLDANHSYSSAYKDIELSDSLLTKNGLLILDDVGPTMSPQMCEEGKGGVRQALLDYIAEHSHMKAIFLEPPYWLNPCGIAIVCKQNIS